VRNRRAAGRAAATVGWPGPTGADRTGRASRIRRYGPGVRRRRPAREPVRDPVVAAVEEDMKPYFAAAGLVGLLGLPAEAAVPVVRRLRGRSGVPVGPAAMNLANAVVAVGFVHVGRRRPARWQRWEHQHIPRWALLTGAAYLALSPAVAAGSERAVILRHRSPLWGALVSPVGLLQFALLLVAVGRVWRARPSRADPGGTPS
jgi:hypothetical protein